jgi:tetratricopeptide (TPR) repeat protein
MPQANALLERIVADQGAANLGQELLMTRASMAQRNGDADAARRLLVQAVAGVREWPERHRQLFPLAKALDSLGRYDEALEVLAEAHGSQAQYFAKAMPGHRDPRCADDGHHAPALCCRGHRRLGPQRRAVDRRQPDLRRGLSRAPARRCSS